MVREKDHFEYDALGNRQGSSNNVASRNSGSTAINFSRRDNGLSQYLNWTPSIVYYDDNFGSPYVYPGNGVLMADGFVTASYNALNQPIAIWSFTYQGTPNFVWFGYDPLGRCVKRWVSDSGDVYSNPATYFQYDGWHLLQEGTDAWGPARIYVHGNRVDEIAWSYNTFTGDQAFHHYDARGHCTTLTDSLGNILEQYEYDAFGQPYFYDATGTATYVDSQPGSIFGNRFLFTGREWLSDLHLYDYRNRMYQPELGRFLQPDPKEFEAGDYNLYRYCRNDPVNKSDPTGLVTLDYQRFQPVLGSNIWQWVTKFTVTFNDKIGGNHADEKPESHLKTGLIANDSRAHGKTEAKAWTRDLGSQKLEANLVINWWVNPAAVAKFGYANIARLEKEHIFGGDYKIKGLIEKGGFWDQERDKIKNIDVFRFRDSAYAAQKLTDEVNSDLVEYQRLQKAEMDFGGRSAPHYLPPF